MLEECAISRKRVIPGALESSAISGRRALEQFFITSSVSGTRCLKDEAIMSSLGGFCTRAESQRCAWSCRDTHPNDIRKCELTGLTVHFTYCTRHAPYRLAPLAEMLDGTRRAADQQILWNDIGLLAATSTDGRCTVEGAQSSPDGQQLAVCVEQKKLLGLRTRCLGFVYSIAERAIIGRLAIGKRSNNEWLNAA
jgi:hypothetical protein